MDKRELKSADEARALVDAALRAEPAAMRSFVDRLTPIVQARVVRALRRRAASARGRELRQELEDMTQEVFLSLFDEGGKALRRWDPARGLSLENFVGLLAERQVSSILRVGRRSPWTEDPTLGEDLERQSPEELRAPEQRVASRQTLEQLLLRTRERLSPKGLQLFELAIVEQREVSEIQEITGMSADAVYTWRSRLQRLVKQIAAELEAEASAPRSVPA